MSNIANSLLNLAETKFYEVGLVTALKFRTLSRDPSGDRVMPRAEVRVRAQASQGNIIHLRYGPEGNC